MEGLQQCTSCGSFSARSCSGCHSTAYCGLECQQTDWRTHQYLCRAFKKLSAPSFPSQLSPSHFLAIYFPMVNSTYKPQLRWLDTEEDTMGYVKPVLTEVLHIPGQTSSINRGIQIVQGNIMRGRPKFLDSLNIRYMDDFDTDQLPVNHTLHGGPSAVCAYRWGDKFWTGPIIAYLKAGNEMDAKKMTDMNLTTYCNAINYLVYFRDTVGSMIDWPGSKAHLSKQIMEERSGKVKGVRIKCCGDSAGHPTCEFVPVDVPQLHPVFVEGDDPLDISENFGESWVVYRYNSYKDLNAEDAQNIHRKCLLWEISEDSLDRDGWGKILEWRLLCTSGSLLVVDQSKRDLDCRKVKAVCKLVEERVLPLLSDEPHLESKAILDALTPELLEQIL
ncbi:hypothetical protein M3J09_012138 [Ascochyta lentis]